MIKRWVVVKHVVDAVLDVTHGVDDVTLLDQVRDDFGGGTRHVNCQTKNEK